MAHYLVTGGAGFVGHHLCRALLAAGHKLRVIDDLSNGNASKLSDVIELQVADIRDSSAIANALQGVDGVFHLAAIPIVSADISAMSKNHEINSSATLQLMAQAKVPIIYASSAATYGDQSANMLDENLLPKPISTYGADKLSCEHFAHVMWQARKLPSVGLRFFNLYGEGQDPKSPYSGVISIFMQRIKAGLPLTIYGDGEQTRDFVDVSDAVKAMQVAMQLMQTKPQCAVANVATSRAISITNLAKIIRELGDSSAEIIYESARSQDIRHATGSNVRMRELLDFSTETPLELGLENLYKVAS